MISLRILMGLLQPLLAILLLAGMPMAEPGGDATGHGVRGVEDVLTMVGLPDRSMAHWPLDASTEPDGCDGDGPQPFLVVMAQEALLHRARPIAVGRTSYATAPPSHRPCAAPPTGPPLI